MVLSSGIHVVYTMYRTASFEPSAQFDLSHDQKVEAQLLVKSNRTIRPSLYLEVDQTEWGAIRIQYAYVFKTTDGVLSKGSGAIAAGDAGANTKTGVKDALVRVEKFLPDLKFENGDQTLMFEITFDEARNTGSFSAAVRFYLDPPLFRLSFLSLVGVWTLGILLVLAGALKWANNVKTPAISRSPEADSEGTRLWLMLCHLSALLGYVFPFGHVLGPLAVWMFRRDRVPGVEAAGRESLNFQLTVTMMGLIGVMLSVVFIGLVLLFLVVVFHFCMTLYASIRVQRGGEFSYPLTVRFIKN